jgi:hypothetical protein
VIYYRHLSRVAKAPRGLARQPFQPGFVNTPQEIYASVRPQLHALATSLLERSEKLLRERGDFLPHAAVLTAEGRVALVGAMCNTPDGFANAAHIMPMLHQGLRAMAWERALSAIGIAEDSTIDLPEGGQSQAIRVLLEHREGVALLIHQPFRRGYVGDLQFGKSRLEFVDPEIKPWD